MACKGITDYHDYTAILRLKQVSMGFLPIGGSTPLFPVQSASYPQGIAKITG